MKNVPDDYKIEDMQDVQTIVSRIDATSIQCTAHIDAGIVRIIGKSKSMLVMQMHFVLIPSCCRVKKARQQSSGEEDPDMSDVLVHLRIKARDNGRLPVPVGRSEVLEKLSSNHSLHNSSGTQKLCMQVSPRIQAGPGWSRTRTT